MPRGHIFECYALESPFMVILCLEAGYYREL